MLPYSPGSLPTDAAAKRAAHEFAGLVGRIVNTTVSQCPISFVEVDGPEFGGFVAHCERKAPVPMRLVNGRYLFLYQRLGLRRDERFLTTLEYKYQYQESEDDESWIFRYDYQREPREGYPYPLAHMHINGQPDPYSGHKPFRDLHLPTGSRVTIEDITRHLLDEHEVPAVSPDWQDVLAGARHAFDEIQKRRLLAA